MDSTTLYEEDVETWAEIQVAALRRLAQTPGPWANAVDWDNVIEEIEDLGSDRRHAVESLLEQAFAHALKIAGDPTSLSSEHWRLEIKAFLDQARTKIKRSMRSRIDMEGIWRCARKNAAESLKAFDLVPPDMPSSCPYTFDHVLDPDFEPLRDLRVLVSPAAAKR